MNISMIRTSPMGTRGGKKLHNVSMVDPVVLTAPVQGRG